MYILTHRGLDPTFQNYYQESSLEAFDDQLKRGFGLEFDLQFTKDKKIVVSHDENLFYFTKGKDKRNIKDLYLKELQDLEFEECHIQLFDDLIQKINDSNNKNINAIHLKHSWQTKEYLDIIISSLNNVNFEKFIIFDLKPKTAKYIKIQRKNINLAASVAHEYDIKRYNKYVGDTLLNINELIKYKDLYNWAWLDEWDRKDADGSKKVLYNSDVFKILRNNSFNIALVSPELHNTSPNLLGGEIHEDAISENILFNRIKDIIKLSPDAICTDYPDRVKKIYNEVC